MCSGQRSEGQEAFVFDINARRVRLTNEEILEGLRRYATVHGWKAFRCSDFRDWTDRPFEPNTAIQRFGSWRRALALIGVQNARARRHNPEELMAILEKVWRQLGRPPGCTHLRRRGHVGNWPYRRCWGSLRRACELLAAHHRGEITRDELLQTAPTGPAATRKKVPIDVRWKVFRRDRFRCVACGKSPATHAGVDLEVDHVIPVSRGGTNDESNLRTLCGSCNRGKKDGD